MVQEVRKAKQSMDEKSLAVALEDTLAESTIDIISDIAEVGLDAVLDDGLLKDIPIISTAVSLFKIGKTIHDRVYVKQLGVFIDEIRKHTVNEEKRQKYINKLKENEAFRNKELEYLLTIIARYIGYEKPRMLAKTYLVYLEKRISWVELTVFSEIIDRLLPGDYEELKKGNQLNISDKNVSDHLLRLIAMGLMVSHVKDVAVATTVGSISIPAQTEKDYEITAFGKTFLECLSK